MLSAQCGEISLGVIPENGEIFKGARRDLGDIRCLAEESESG